MPLTDEHRAQLLRCVEALDRTPPRHHGVLAPALVLLGRESLAAGRLDEAADRFAQAERELLVGISGGLQPSEEVMAPVGPASLSIEGWRIEAAAWLAEALLASGDDASAWAAVEPWVSVAEDEARRWCPGDVVAVARLLRVGGALAAMRGDRAEVPRLARASALLGRLLGDPIQLVTARSEEAAALWTTVLLDEAAAAAAAGDEGAAARLLARRDAVTARLSW